MWHSDVVAKNRCGTRSNSLGSLGRGSCQPRAPRLSLFIPRDAGLDNPPRTADGMDHILQMMEVAWRQVNTARGSTVKLANPEHNLLVSLECARDFMLGVLTEPDPGRQRLAEIFGGDCSRVARVRAILDGATLSHRNCADDRISSCMNAVKSVEAVLKKDCGVGRRLSEAQRKEFMRLRERQSRFQAKHLRGEFSPLSKTGSPSQSRSSWFGFPTEAAAEATTRTNSETAPLRARSDSAPSLRGDGPAVSSFSEGWQALRDHWESGNLFRNLTWGGTSQEGNPDGTAVRSPRGATEVVEAEERLGLHLVADPMLDGDPKEDTGHGATLDPYRCISVLEDPTGPCAEPRPDIARKACGGHEEDAEKACARTVDGGQPLSETPSTWTALEGAEEKDGATSTTSDTPRAQTAEEPGQNASRGFSIEPGSTEQASGKSSPVPEMLAVAALELPSLRGNEDAPADQDPLPSACPETAETLFLHGGSGPDPTAEDVSGVGFAQGSDEQGAAHDSGKLLEVAHKSDFQDSARGPPKGVESDGSSSDEDVPMPANWGMPRQKRGSVIRPVALPTHLLQQAKAAGYSEEMGVVEFRVGRDEEKIGIAFKILPPAGHLVVERISAGTPAEALHLPKGSRLLCVNGIHTGQIEAEDFFETMRQRPLDLLFLKPSVAQPSD
ncbi:unnamed protein product [Symbiodinium natans]|uniref:PDZ domain-containing protein n=1 Tax=Symbiodinium natans TaxID=878477 RepID=A0A812PNF8_9DINO|nr:unnamed protein product [Symbiodinium natans]